MKIVVTAEEIIDNGVWDEFCDDRGLNVYAVNEGMMDSNEEIVLTEEEARKYGFIHNDWFYI